MSTQDIAAPAAAPAASPLPAPGTSPRLLSVATALPDHVVRQEDARAFAAQLFHGGLLDADPRLR